jgi:hypothetical protein
VCRTVRELVVGSQFATLTLAAGERTGGIGAREPRRPRLVGDVDTVEIEPEEDA